MYIVKRYPNRKLYDTNQSCYITLDELRDIVRVYGSEVKVIDTKSKKDITGTTLLAVIHNHEKRYAEHKADVYIMFIQKNRGIL